MRINRITFSISVLFLLLKSASASAQVLCDSDYQTLRPNGGAIGDLFGQTLDMSADTLVIGAEGADALGMDSGSAYVYQLASGGQWIETSQLSGSTQGINDGFGAGVAIGTNRIVVGAPRDGGPTPGFGSVFVFERQANNTWLQISRLLASDRNTGDEFGKSVAITSDDNTIVVGAPSKSQPGVTLQSGAAYVFEFDSVSGTFQETARLLSASPATNEEFGDRLAVDGNRIAASGDALTTLTTGAIYVFERLSGVWQQTATLTPSMPPPSFSSFAESLDLSGDTIATTDRNTLYTYDYAAGTGWTEAAQPIGTALTLNGVTLDGDDRLAVRSNRAQIDVVEILQWNQIAGSWLSVEEFEPDQTIFLASEVADVVLDGNRVVSGESQFSFGMASGTGLAFAFKANAILGTSDGCLSASTGGMITFDIDAGSANAGNGYWILGSASGTSPGFDYNGTNIPLNIDPYLNLTIDPAASPISGGVGALDANGQASATLSVNADPSLAGGTAYHVCVIYDIATFGVIEVSDVIPLSINP